MIKDIELPETKNVQVAIAPDDDTQWQVFLINNGEETIKNVLVNSSGYGQNENGEKIETSILRFFFDEIGPKSYEIIERIDPSVFGINNEYWLSFWIGEKLYDRRYVYVPESIDQKNLVYVKAISKEAVLHA